MSFNYLLSITFWGYSPLFASSVYLILTVSSFFSLSGSISDELPLNIAAEVHCLKGTTPKTTEKEETTVAAVQMQPSEGYVSLTRFLCRSFLKRGLINWQKECSSPKPKRVLPLESALPLTVELALHDMWKTSESNATSQLGSLERHNIIWC